MATWPPWFRACPVTWEFGVQTHTGPLIPATCLSISALVWLRKNEDEVAEVHNDELHI